jgi:hypothetical protein
MADSAGLYRLELSYELADDGRLVAPDLPARLVPARGEGALYRHIAALADAPDTAIAAAASRYGPLGPLGPLPLTDPPAFMWSAGELLRQTVLDIDPLRHWIATGGNTPVPARLARSAHILAALAETDPVLAQQLVDVFTQGGLQALPDEERQRLAQAYDVQEQVFLAAIGRREQLFYELPNEADAAVRVIPKPGTGRYLALAARYLQTTVTASEDTGTIAALVPPDSVGRLLTILQPYLEQNLVPTETVSAWRQAATELQGWATTLRAATTASPGQIAEAADFLNLRLRQVYAWPYPSGQLLGAFGRALWTVRTRLLHQPPQRGCTWLTCATLLPPNAHGNRHYCDAHRREAARTRSARRRQQNQAG